MKILHILRAPIGGLFRHVRDLASQQIKMGHEVGFITAKPANSAYVAKTFSEIEAKLTLGLQSLDISRLPSLSDYKNIKTIQNFVIDQNIDVIHGHGAKGGAYARLVKAQISKSPATNVGVKAFYTLHGGTLHYSPTSPVGFVFLKLEKYLQQYTDGLIFESQTSRRTFEAKIAQLQKPFKVIYNGLSADEFYQKDTTNNPADFLYIGELRRLKGVDLLINAFARLCRDNISKHKLKLTIIGYGPDEELFKSLVAKAGIYDHVTFLPPMPAAEAFSLAKVQVMPSRAEGLPYMILETLAAKMPLIASNVGGIPEIYGEHSDLLFEKDDQTQLYQYMKHTLLSEKNSRHVEMTDILQNFVKKNFNVEDMAQQITDFYQ